MAIGHAPEIGVSFGGGFERDEYGFCTVESMTDFYKQWKEVVGDDLLGGWAELIRSDRSEEEALKRPTSARYQGTIPQNPVPLSCLYTTIDRGHTDTEVAVQAP